MKRFFIIFICLVLFCAFKRDQVAIDREPLQYPKSHHDTIESAIRQLSAYPLPRYFSSHKLLPLFNWMDPYYMGGRGQPSVRPAQMNDNAVAIQKELALNWHYGIVLPNAGSTFNGIRGKDVPPFIQLANEHPELPLHIITFWGSVNPKQIGLPYNRAMIINQKSDSSLYIRFTRNGKIQKEPSFVFPDSLIRIDGAVQNMNIRTIIKYLTRPIDMINENGEEPPGPYLVNYLKKDPVMIQLKQKLGIESWEEFMALRKLHLRDTYSSCFMKDIPELKKTKFSFYTVEAGPIDRFDWLVMKKSMTPINGIYYSTPDYYPRWPKNWRDWMGPWHGWKWIEAGRPKEIKGGDHLFSPFVAAGWSGKEEDDIRPGQWLGLLKCLAGIGAEFYYVGYFNTSAPFTDPAKWVWQAAMPAYAQAVTSRYEDVLKDGNVFFNEKKSPVITYTTTDKHVLVTARKHNQKEKYIICGTYQPFSNVTGEIPEKKNISIAINGQEFSFEVRRQGSVYVYEKTPEGKVLFYQLDSWHENAHPDHWSKDFCFEAEVADAPISNDHIFTINKKGNTDFTDFTTYVLLNKETPLTYNFTQRDNITSPTYVWICYKGSGTISLHTKKTNEEAISLEEKFPECDSWKWKRIQLPSNFKPGGSITLSLLLKKGTIDLDKLIVTEKDRVPTQ